MSQHRRRAPRPAALVLGAAVIAATASGCSSDADPAPDEPPPSPSSSVTTATSAESSQTVDDLIAVGLAQVAQRDYRLATATFESVQALDPDNVYAVYNLGFVAEQRGDDAGAITSYVAALEIDDAFTPALYNLARLTESSDLAAAVGFYRRVLAVEPDEAATSVRLGYALQHLGRVREGERLVRRGVELDPGLADVQRPTYD